MKRVRVECGALRVEGDVLVDMPVNQSRILDVLNRPGAFLNVREGDRHHLVRKAGITRVSEPSAGLEAAAIAPRAMTDAGERALLVGLALGGRGRAPDRVVPRGAGPPRAERGRARRGDASSRSGPGATPRP